MELLMQGQPLPARQEARSRCVQALDASPRLGCLAKSLAAGSTASKGHHSVSSCFWTLPFHMSADLLPLWLMRKSVVW